MLRKTFEELSKDELYALAKLRQQVFIIEQNSIYLDLDDCDQQAIHYLDFNTQGELIAYARYRSTAADALVKIERVVLAGQARGIGLGKALIKTMLQDIQSAHPLAQISLSSQVEASKFYQRLGFVEVGEVYDDGGVMHIGMVYQKGVMP